MDLREQAIEMAQEIGKQSEIIRNFSGKLAKFSELVSGLEAEGKRLQKRISN